MGESVNLGSDVFCISLAGENHTGCVGSMARSSQESAHVFFKTPVVTAASSILMLPFPEQSALTHEHPHSTLDFRSFLSLMSFCSLSLLKKEEGLVSKIVKGLFGSGIYN